MIVTARVVVRLGGACYGCDGVGDDEYEGCDGYGVVGYGDEGVDGEVIMHG